MTGRSPAFRSAVRTSMLCRAAARAPQLAELVSTRMRSFAVNIETNAKGLPPPEGDNPQPYLEEPCSCVLLAGSVYQS